MSKPNGLHHVAISTADIAGQIEFFSDVLGMELVALYPMHGAENALHAFVKANDHCYVAFVTMPGIDAIPIEVGKTHAGFAALPSAPGTMQHLALNVDSEADLLAMRDRIRLKGVNVLGPLDHGFCKSIYFAGPEQLTLEVSVSEAGIDARAWIDPEVVRQVGISADDLERYRRPELIQALDAPVPQPPIDPSKPRMTMPDEQYRALVGMSDGAIAALMDDPNPPVRLEIA